MHQETGKLPPNPPLSLLMDIIETQSVQQTPLHASPMKDSQAYNLILSK